MDNKKSWGEWGDIFWTMLPFTLASDDVWWAK